MQIREVDFPETLLTARQDDTLVIFAGAGVSIPLPSNYPNFEQLADQISSGTLQRIADEPLDRFLGRLEKQEVSVHQTTRRILSNSDSRPNPLHHNLLNLFPSTSQVRLVTTNFDNHFTTAANTDFVAPVEIYYAPALPLGQQFHGIVYLHGSVDKEPKNLVLTDGDFGRAYLTDGWARRFLRALFSRYTVLFIGYSHNDPVMNYLARGLPPDSSAPRFVLCPNDRDEHWNFLGITPIHYPLRDGENRHGALGESLAGWVDLSKMATLDHEQRIREIVERPPPLDRESNDYIENALKDVATTRFFVRHAKLPDWLRWAESKQPFKLLFQPNAELDSVSYELATWFSRSFVCQYPYEALAVLERQGQKPHNILWHSIVNELYSCETWPNPEIIALWVMILIRYGPEQNPQFSLLSALLCKCRYPEDNVTALLLFEYLVTPRPKLKRGFRFSEENSEILSDTIDIEIVFDGTQYYLDNAWKNLFRPNISVFVDKLEPILVNQIQECYLFQMGRRSPEDYFDHLSFMRSAIEPHEQDQYREGIDVIIDATRELIEWMLINKPDYAHSRIEAWANSDFLLLKRLAIHGMSESNGWSPNEKLAWILERNWLCASDLKHEFFRLLEHAYPHATDANRQFLLEHVCLASEDHGDQDAEEIYTYEIYNLLVWLHHIAPECPFTTEKFEAMQQAHPEFSPREHPDFEHWSSSGPVETTSPLSVEEVLSRHPEERIQWLLTYQTESFRGPSRKGLLSTVSEASATSFDWGWQLVTALSRRDEWTSDLWKALFQGWYKATMSEEQWEKVLTLLRDQQELYAFKFGAADLLQYGMRKEAGEIPLTCLSLAQHVADQLWDVYARGPSEQLSTDSSWLTKAINRPEGKLVEFWLYGLSKQRAEAGDNWTGISEESKGFFHKVLSSTTPTVELGAVILASRLYFLFALEPDWTRQNVLTLLDWSRNPRRAQQGWHGFLTWGRWNEALLSDLMPLYEQTFSHMSELVHLRDRLCADLASIAMFSMRNPVGEGWLGRFLRTVETKDRKRFAGHISHLLCSLDEDAVRNLWNRWMCEYWQQRISGVPYRLENDELEEMIEWALHLKPVFSAVVDKICESPAPSLADTGLYHSFVESDFASTQPEPLAKLLIHLLQNAHEPFWQGGYVEKLVRRLSDTSVSRDDLRKICNELGRLGYAGASALRRVVDGQ